MGREREREPKRGRKETKRETKRETKSMTQKAFKKSGGLLPETRVLYGKLNIPRLTGNSGKI